jgi:predicted nucleotidyltransferase
MPNMGMMMPNMGSTTAHPSAAEARIPYLTSGMGDALFTTTQQRVLSCFFAGDSRSYTVSDVIRVTGSGSGAVQRELRRLLSAGLLLLEPVGNQKRYRANPDAPIHAELKSIVCKTFGLAQPLWEALAPLAGDIRAALVYGSVADGRDGADSDIDLLVISDTLNYGDLMRPLDPLIRTMGRDVNPTIYTSRDFDKRLGEGNSFLVRLLQRPVIWLIGSADDLGA